jgi:hypothetical protein
MKPHKHAEIIKAWADGAEIQSKTYDTGCWIDIPDNDPLWNPDTEYRIKPTPIKIDVVMFQHIRLSPRGNILAHPDEKPNIKYIFDGETRQVKSVEVLK